jgi:hypothetical protein
MSGPAHSDLPTFQQEISLSYLWKTYDPKTSPAAKHFIKRIAQESVNHLIQVTPLHSELEISTHCKNILHGKTDQAGPKPSEVQLCPLEIVPITSTARETNLNEKQKISTLQQEI